MSQLPSKWVNIHGEENFELSDNNTSLTKISDAYLPLFLTANHDIPMANNFYFEVTLVQGYNSIAVGLGRCVMQYDSAPGNAAWPKNNSFIYYSDTGMIWLKDIGKEYGMPLRINDVLGCGIDRGKRSIFFTINGTFLGEAFHLDSIPSLIPIVGIRVNGTKIKANFGQDPFIYQPNPAPLIDFPTQTTFSDEWVNHVNFSSQATEGN